MVSLLALILLLNPVSTAPLSAVDDLSGILSMGNSLATFSCESAIPTGICADSEGGFAIVTERPSQLLLIDAAGRKRADPVILPPEFAHPRGVLALNRGHFVVADDSGAFGEIDRSGRLVRMLPGPATRWQPGAIAFAPRGEGFLVTDLLRRQVHQLDLDGNLQQSWEGFVEPRGVCALGEKIWVSDRGYHRLLPLDADQPSVDPSRGIGDHGAAPGLLAGPAGICGFGDRVILLSDRDNHRIQVFGTHGISMHSWGIHALLPRESRGRLHYPEAVALDSSALVCAVTEPSERRVQLFGVRDPEVEVEAAEMWQRVDLVSHYGEFWAVESDHQLVAISEPDSETVSVLAPNSEIPFVLDEVGGNGDFPARFRTPVGVDFLPGLVFPRMVVADRGNQRLQMFEIRRNSRAALRREPWLIALVRTVDLAQLTTETAGWKAQFAPRPGAVTCLKDGTLAVSDTANARILVLDQRFRPQRILSARGMFEQATALAADGDGVLVADARKGQLFRFLLAGGQPTLIESGALVPVGVDRHPDGSIWVTDAGRHALLRIPPEGGEPQIVLQGPGTGEKELYRPRSVQITRDGFVWVLDYGNHRGVVLATNGAEVTSIRHFGSPPYMPGYQVSRQQGGR